MGLIRLLVLYFIAITEYYPLIRLLFGDLRPQTFFSQYNILSPP